MLSSSMSRDQDLNIQRPVYQLEDLHNKAQYAKQYVTAREKLNKFWQQIHPLEFFLNTVPILKWLPEYSWKKSFFNDCISGTTVAIIHIPQGFAYALLGNVTPIIGIYMAFFPVLIYTVFGTSRHVSMGTFAIVCLMAGKVVKDHATADILANGTVIPLIDEPGVREVTNFDVAVTLSFGVGTIMVIMWALHLGTIIENLMSDTMVSAFTCGSAFYVVAAQFKDLLGLTEAMRSETFSLMYTIYDVIMAISDSNMTATTISGVTLIVLALNDTFFKPWLAKRSKIPFPIELIVIAIGTVVTYFTGIDKTHNISTVGFVPTGLPKLSVPIFSILPDIMVDSFVIAMVSYATTMSLALMFAKKNMYEVDSNQDLLGQGLSNLVGAFSTCLPVAACLSRSMIQEAVGGVTQITGVVSSFLLLILLLWAGPILSTAPKCILASTIVIACKELIWQVKDFPRYWRLNIYDGFVWALTFIVTLVIGISEGLGVGVVASLVSVAAQGLKPHASTLGRLAGTEIYLDIKNHKAAIEVPGLKIFRYVGGLNFAFKESFRVLFVQHVGIDPVAVLRKKATLMEKGLPVDEKEYINVKGVIIDLSSLTFIDPTGVDGLKRLQVELEKLNIFLYIASCSASTYEVIMHCDKWTHQEIKFLIFPTLYDATVYAQATMSQPANVCENPVI